MRHTNGNKYATDMTTTVFSGSFDPFTIGHHAIVRRALSMFDKIIIAVGHNERKRCMWSAAERVDAIRRLYASEPRVQVGSYTGLTVDFARARGAAFIVRGVRSVKDFEYERDQADINLRIGGIDTVMLTSEAQYSGISSSMVRELMHFGRNVDEFLPPGYQLDAPGNTRHNS